MSEIQQDVVLTVQHSEQGGGRAGMGVSRGAAVDEQQNMLESNENYFLFVVLWIIFLSLKPRSVRSEKIKKKKKKKAPKILLIISLNLKIIIWPSLLNLSCAS